VANEKISQLTAGAPAQGTDLLPIARSGANYSLKVSDILAQGASSVALSSAGETSPSPAYSPNEAPSGEGVTIFSEDVNGKWHQQVGMDESTTLASTTWAATTSFSLRQSIVDQVGNLQVVTTAGTSGGSEPTFGTTLGATTAEGADTLVWTCRGLNAQSGTMTLYRRTYWRDNQSTTMLNGNALVSIQHTLGHGTNGGSLQDHGLYVQAMNDPADPGPIYSMVGLQCETDFNGAPALQPVVDGEISCASYQFADNHTGSIAPPTLGVSCSRVQYYREEGSGTYSSVGPAGIRVRMTNNSTVDYQFQAMTGIEVQVSDETGTPLHMVGIGITVLAPGSNRLDDANIGISTGNFGLTHANDIAIEVAGGLCIMGVTSFQQFTVSTLPTGGIVSEGVQAYATNGRKVGEGAGSGTGVPVYFSNGQWRVYSTDAQVQA
jgi:hypothetical protein